MIGFLIWGLIISIVLWFIAYRKGNYNPWRINKFVIKHWYFGVCFLIITAILSNVGFSSININSSSKENNISSSSSSYSYSSSSSYYSSTATPTIKSSYKIGDKVYVSESNRFTNKETGTHSVTLLEVKPVRCIETYCSIDDGKRLIAAKIKIDDIVGEAIDVSSVAYRMQFHTVDGLIYANSNYSKIDAGFNLSGSNVSISAGNNYEGWIPIQIPLNVDVTKLEMKNVATWILQDGSNKV